MKKQRHTLIYFISFLLLSQFMMAQQDTIVNTLKYNNTYGIRLGIDLNTIVKTIVDDEYKGFEVVGDYRLSKKVYLASELGFEERIINETSINTTTQGNFIRLGVDYNVYKNLVGMRNLIYTGFRYGYSNFSQELNQFSIASSNSFFDSQQIRSDLSSDGLSAHWIEFVVGIKAEVVSNLFVGFSLAVKRKLTDEKPEGFDNLFIPGFGKTNDFGEFGAGFNYFISYYIPIKKKKK